MMEVLYILSCCWTSPDPDALFICYLKIRSYLPRHCLPPDTRGIGYLAKREAGIHHPVPAVAIQCATQRYLGIAQTIHCVRPRCCACCLSFSSLHLLLLLLSPRSWLYRFFMLGTKLALLYVDVCIHIRNFYHVRGCVATFWRVPATSPRTTSSTTTDTLTH